MLEALITGPETALADFRPALEAAAELGASRANTLFRPDPDGGGAIARFGELSDICGEYGLELVAEVSPDAWADADGGRRPDTRGGPA